LVAITILLIVIVGPMKISSQASKSSSFSSEQVTAFFLAQEGIELVEEVRDELALVHFPEDDVSAQPWDLTTSAVLQNCFIDVSSKGCGLSKDPSPSGPSTPGGDLATVQNCTTISNCKLYYDAGQSAQSRYVHNSTGNTATPFTRRILLETIGGGDEIKITAIVTWRTGALRNEQQVQVETRLFNIYDS
jgi:hypothetical protein